MAFLVSVELPASLLVFRSPFQAMLNQRHGQAILLRPHLLTILVATDFPQYVHRLRLSASP